jgi:hypothetical protein
VRRVVLAPLGCLVWVAIPLLSLGAILVVVIRMTKLSEEGRGSGMTMTDTRSQGLRDKMRAEVRRDAEWDEKHG